MMHLTSRSKADKAAMDFGLEVWPVFSTFAAYLVRGLSRAHGVDPKLYASVISNDVRSVEDRSAGASGCRHRQS